MATCIRAANPIWFFNDLIGFPLNDQFFISFLTNTFPYLPQSVFQDVNCTLPWANPLQFFPNGSLPNNMYWDPNLVWRLEIRQGPTQSDPLIYEVNNFMPGQGTGGVTPNNLLILTAENQITNPQFAQVFFTTPHTITVAGTYDIAPGWQLILSGTGTTTISQLVFSGTSALVEPNNNSIPYALRIDNAGWTTAVLNQRLSHNGALWAGGAVGGVVVARSEIADRDIAMEYLPSDGGTPIPILVAHLTTGNFVEFSGAVDIVQSTNTDLSTIAFVDIQIVLPATGIVNISDIQLTGQNVPLPSPLLPNQLPIFNDETIERAIDHEFHVYSDSILLEPKTNLLAGWIFGLNPWQFNSTAQANLANNAYTADQTIIVQQAYVTSATGNNISVGQGLITENLCLKIGAVTATNKFALIQYIDPQTIAPYWNQFLSALVQADLSSVVHFTSTVRFKMRIIVRDTLPPTVAQNEPIFTWSNVNGSDPVFAAGWTAIVPENDPEYTFSPNTTNNKFSFNKFLLPNPNAGLATNMIGVVVYTTTNMNSAGPTQDFLLFQKISLVPNDFAIEASPETFDESLKRCQAYFEKSYDPGVPIGSTTFTNASSTQVSSALTQVFGLDRPYKAVKVITPDVFWYAPQTGTFNAITNNTGGAADVAINNVVLKGRNSTGVPVLAAPGLALGDQVSAHWFADARLGR